MVERMPTRLVCEAGPQIELPVSVPRPAAPKFAATAAAVPPLESRLGGGRGGGNACCCRGLAVSRPQPGRAAAHLGDLVGRPVQCVTNHQEDPLSVAPPRLLGDRPGGGLAEHHRFHRAKGDAPGLQHIFLL
jgi:hypothetical protein